jgi:prophage regulatory protein
MSVLPETGFLRLPQILGNPKTEPPTPPIIPVKKSCWWEGVKSGRFPKPVKLGMGRGSFWRVEDIRRLIASASRSGESIAKSTSQRLTPGLKGAAK